MKTSVSNPTNKKESQNLCELNKGKEPPLDPCSPVQLHNLLTDGEGERLCMRCVHLPCLCALTLLEERLEALKTKEILHKKELIEVEEACGEADELGMVL